MDRDVFLGDAEGLGHLGLGHLRRLGGRPELDLAVLEVGRRVLGLERRVRQEGIRVRRRHLLGRRRERSGDVA